MLISALNNLDIQGADIQNTYLNTDNHEKVGMRASSEFGELEGKQIIVKKALYGIKSAGSLFR